MPNRWLLANTLHDAEEWREASDVLEALAAEFPDDIVYVGLLGCAAARLGNRTRALEVSEQLATMIEGDLLDRRPVAQARIAAVLGERAETVRLLEETFRQKWLHYTVLTYPYIDFESLRDYEPFQS